MPDKSLFSEFTNLYSLTKTIRFELKPIGNTLTNMYKNLEYDVNLKTFLKDQKIEDAYQTLKPEIDKIHEEFITDSLESDSAKKISFVDYLAEYRKKDDKRLDTFESNLRKEIGKLFAETSSKWSDKETGKYKQYTWKKGSDTAKSYNVLLTKVIILLVGEKNRDNQKIQESVTEILKFYGYLSGFNQNRENYYETSKEASTAVATRIISENLPKFCDNLIQFECITKKRKDKSIERMERKVEYLGAYNYLKGKNKETQIRDAKTNLMMEAKPIVEELFDIKYFAESLSQDGIEKYNKIIGHHNLLINLYNQAKRAEEKDLKKNEKTFKNLPPFKTLFKQIGCGKSEALFFTITHDTKVQSDIAVQQGKKAISLQEVLDLYKTAGQQFFIQSNSDGITTVPSLNTYIKEKEDYTGLYWSKKTINTISNMYFANWHQLKESLKESKVFKKDKEEIKIPEVVGLQTLFEVLDEVTDWKSQGVLFKESIFNKKGNQQANSEKKFQILENATTSSQALLGFIFSDIEENIEDFVAESETISKITDYKANIDTIKTWLDKAKTVVQLVKYFQVQEKKIKGEPLDPVVAEALKLFLDSENTQWFSWYDAVRNYLTKKPQDDAKENTLKLNFENSSLLGGFVDSHTENSDNGTQFGAYVFRKKVVDKYKYYIGVSKDSRLFRVHLKDFIPENDRSEYERLEYYQAKSTTFFSTTYTQNKNKLIDCLQILIKNKFNSKRKIISEEEKLDKINKLEIKLLNSNTPTGLIDGIIKLKQLDIIEILSDEKLNNLVAETILEIKNNIKIYENRASKLKDIQKIKYEGHTGLKTLIKDLGEIAKVQKVYNYFPVSQVEFRQTTTRNDKPVYMFEIVNKDIQNNSLISSNKNLHTLYFEKMLHGNQTTFDIGSGEIFYRKQALKDKKIKLGYEKKPWIIENKRFTENNKLSETINLDIPDDQNGKSFFLHLSIKMNYSAIEGISNGKSSGTAFNLVQDKVKANFMDQSETYFLGIDRGEKHLAYYSLVNQDGKIIDQGTLNIPFVDKDGKERSIKKERSVYNKDTKKWDKVAVECKNYNDLLEVASSNRDEARENWHVIGNIKNLKNGYVSQVVHKITNLAVDLENPKPTYIVLEDLNSGFMRGRQKIEKSVYQKLELALAKKLNFLVDKNKVEGVGSVIQALQLTPHVTNFGDIEHKKQVGIILYTRANYTSQTDPVTGWRKTIYIQRGSEESIKTQILGGKIKKNNYLPKFTDILYENGDYIFVYYAKYTNKKWKLNSSQNGKSLDRFRGSRGADKNEWIIAKQNINEILNKVFAKFDKNLSLLDQLNEGAYELAGYENMKPWDSLRFAVDLIQQIRNTGGYARDNDFILSPVRNEIGKHFDSREFLVLEQRKEKASLPTSGDANGSYNIARKGIIMNEHIKRELDLYISDEEWDCWLDDKMKWEEWLDKNKINAEKEKKK